MPNPNYKIHKHGDSVRCGMMDRIDGASKDILKHDLPYSVWGSCVGFVLGEVVAFCPSEEHAVRITKALTLLKQVEEII